MNDQSPGLWRNATAAIPEPHPFARLPDLVGKRLVSTSVSDDLSVGPHEPASCVMHDTLSRAFRAPGTMPHLTLRAMRTEQDIRKQQAKRLREARAAAGFEDATSAAAALAMSRDTYIQHENGTRSFQGKAEKYAAKFKTTPEWLLWGRRRDRALGEVIGKVGADPEGAILYSTGDRPLAYVKLPFPGFEQMPILLVAGDSMPNYAPNGSLIFLDAQHNPPTPDMIGHVVAVELDTGEVLLKRLLRGSEPGLWDLESFAGPTRKDVTLAWAALVAMVVQPKAAREMLIDAAEAA